MITPAADRAIDKGLAWLADRQNDDGCSAPGPIAATWASAAWRGMAFMTGGSTPGRGPYGRAGRPRRGLLLANAQQSGFILEPAADQPRADVRPRLRHHCSWPSATACRRGPSCGRNSPRPSS